MMAQPPPEIFQYRTYELITRVYKGIPQSRARKGDETLTTTGTDLHDAFTNIKAAVDAAIKTSFPAKRAEFLVAARKPDLGTRPCIDGRMNHCRACKEPVSSHTNLECVGCGLLICSVCGACYCG